MSSYLNMSNRVMMGAAIVGIVGAAGVFIYEQIYAEKKRSMLVNEVARLDKQVSSMRSELEVIRELQKESQSRRLKARSKHQRPKREKKDKAVPSGDAVQTVEAVDPAELSYASDSEYFTDYQSVLGTDGEMDSEEFYDVHTDDDDDDTLREEKRNGHVTNLLEENLNLDNLKLDAQDNTDVPNSPKKTT